MCDLRVKEAELVVAAIIQFLDGKVADEHLYWGQASLLFQMGILDHPLAAAGADSAARLLKLRRSGATQIGRRPRRSASAKP